MLIPVSLLPKWLGMAGNLYFVGALLLGLTYLYSGIRINQERTVARARAVLLSSIAYLPLLYVLMIADRPRL
jgi:protoheme IX farnesyltransferase